MRHSILLFTAILSLGGLSLSLPALALSDDAAVQHVTEEVGQQLDTDVHEALAEHGAHDDMHTGAHHGDEPQGLPQLDTRWYSSQIFWLALSFILMYLPFRFKVLPDLSSVIERRRERIEGDLIAARNLKQEAENVHAAYATILREARDQSSALFARAESKVKDLEKESFSEFYKKASKEIAETEESIEKAKKEAMGTINDVAAEVAAVAAQQLVGIKTDKTTAKSVIKTMEKKKAA